MVMKIGLHETGEIYSVAEQLLASQVEVFSMELMM
jgi:hypothetical protein